MKEKEKMKEQQMDRCVYVLTKVMNILLRPLFWDDGGHDIGLYGVFEEFPSTSFFLSLSDSQKISICYLNINALQSFFRRTKKRCTKHEHACIFFNVFQEDCFVVNNVHIPLLNVLFVQK